MADYLIAGICLARGGVLLTRNRAHFGGVSGLSLARFEPPDRRRLSDEDRGVDVP